MNKLMRGALALVIVFVVIQLVPYGRENTNPPTVQEPAWDRPETRGLAKRACFDCHSNETKWPWYSSIAPVSWLTQHDVNEGRADLNFSEWIRPQREAAKAADEITKGEMPPRTYILAHPEARLNAAERNALIDGLRNTFARMGGPNARVMGNQ